MASLLWIVVIVVYLMSERYWARSTPLKGNAAYVWSASNLTRPFKNWHNLTALIYLAGGSYAAYHSQSDLALLCLGTFISSSAYHLNHESAYFNLDFLFAAATGFVFVWTLVVAAPVEWETPSLFLVDNLHEACIPNVLYTQIGLVGMPIGLLLFIGCGSPAEIIPRDHLKSPLNHTSTSGMCFCRGESAIYNWIHPIWHVVSGFAPILCVHYYANNCTSPGSVMGLPPLFGAPGFPTVPSYALGTALALNLMANWASVMPLD